MGAKEQKTSTLIQAEESKLAKLNDELKLDLAQSAIDIAGIVDPTPISDVIGAGLSLFRGDFIGAGLSLISVIPYAGDALGKTAKGARLAKKMTGLKKKISAAIASVQAAKAAKFATRMKVTAAVRAKREAEAAAKFAAAKKCKTCKPPTGNRFGSKSPVEGNNGSWKGGERGNAEWHPDPDTEKGQQILQATGGKPVKFKDGYPDFSPHVYPKGSVKIDMKGDKSDFRAARDAMREKLGDPNWPGIPGRNMPKDWTWHHKEDGVTMELVPYDLNSNIAHTGGSSLVKELKNDPGY